MAFKQVCSSLLVVIGCCNVLLMAEPLNYLKDNDQSASPLQNQGSLVYLRDNDNPNQVPPAIPTTVQAVPANNYVSNVVATPQIQTIATIPNAYGNVGLVQYPNTLFGSNIVSNSLPIQYSNIGQAIPLTQYVSNQGFMQPFGQYAVQQPIYVGGPAGYASNQVPNNQVSPVEVNIGSGPGFGI